MFALKKYQDELRGEKMWDLEVRIIRADHDNTKQVSSVLYKSNQILNDLLWCASTDVLAF